LTRYFIEVVGVHHQSDETSASGVSRGTDYVPLFTAVAPEDRQYPDLRAGNEVTGAWSLSVCALTGEHIPAHVRDDSPGQRLV
jgi:hypothetical protein